MLTVGERWQRCSAGIRWRAAVFEFTLRTLARSRSHRLLMAIYVGVALRARRLGASCRSSSADGLAGLQRRQAIELLSAPLVMAFFSLVGMRVAMAIPVEPKANWLLRLVGAVGRSAAAIDGVRPAMLVVGVVPSAAPRRVRRGAAVGHGPRRCIPYMAAMMGWLLVEILLMRFAKLPFTCTYFPGNSRRSARSGRSTCSRSAPTR